MRVICICCYRNEADILEAFVRHTAVYCDELILLDHGSTDASPAIARRLQREGFRLHLLSDATIGNVETDQTNRLLKMAASDMGADWILSLDADEFMTGASDSSFLPAADDGEPYCLKVRTRSYYVHPTDDAQLRNPVERITHRLAAEEDFDLKVFVPGALARQNDGILTQGKHQYFLQTQEARSRMLDGIALAHFSLRTPPQYAMKLASKQLQKCRHISRHGDELIYYNDPYALLKEGYARFEEVFSGQRLAYRLPQSEEILVRDPIEYRGEALRYTAEPRVEVDSFISQLLELSEQLARQSPPPSGETSANGCGPSSRISIELGCGPSPGHSDVINTATDGVGFQTLLFAADCLPDTNALHLSLRGDPGLVEISEIGLQYGGCGREVRYQVEQLTTMLRMLEGGAVIPPTNVFRLLISKEPVRLMFSGWRADELPEKVLLRLRVEHHLAPAVLLSPVVLKTIGDEQQELRSCRTQLETAQREASAYKDYLSSSPYSVGAPIDFFLNGNSSFYIGDGWSHQEAWGRWTDGTRATLHLRFAEAPKRPLRLQVQLAPFLHETVPEQQVRVQMGADEIAVWRLRLPEASVEHADIPADKLHERESDIVFEILHPTSPFELGVANDHRRLGVWFRSVVLQWADEPSSVADGNVS